MSRIEEYARIPIAFRVDRVLRLTVKSNGLEGLILRERPMARPYVKNYDAIDSPGGWPRKFDLTNWGLLAAHLGDRRVGGAMIAFKTKGFHLLEDRDDLAVLWDIRVAPEFRGRGVGSRLFSASERWAKAKGCRQLKVETQNINVPACRFYAAQGCTLSALDRSAYPSLPDEIQLIWRKNL